MKYENRNRPIFSIMISIFLLAASAAAQTTIFTYQGKLSDAGTPPTGTYQMEFRLFDAVFGGAQIGAVITNNSVSVTEGVFTVNLNFGSTAFPGADRFLQISVRRNADEGFVTLNPRQQIASSPYSIRTLTAAQADPALNSNQLGGVPANQYLQTNGNGSGLTNLNAASITTGTLSNARLGQIPTANIADNAVTAPKIATGQVVKGVTVGATTLTDNV